MVKKILTSLGLIAVISVFAVVVIAQESEELAAPLMDDFETEELFTDFDQFGNAIGHAEWGDSAGNVELSLTEIERDGEMTSALAITYDIAAWGGFTHALNDGENWISQDWTAFSALQFSLYGNNTGGTIQIEIFDNRNLGLNGDTAERWFFRITDDYEGWQDFSIPFEVFQRRTDFQPGGAPNDGLGLDAVSGYAFSMPVGTGAQTAYLDNVTVVPLDVEPLIINDFEVDELFTGFDAEGNGIGFVTWGDVAASGGLRLVDIVRNSSDSTVLAVDYDVASFGGFSNVFTDEESWTPQNWTEYNTIEFWVFGSNTGEEIQFEIFDNLNPDANGDSAERWFYRFADDTLGWKQISIPFVDFQRRSDWQPSAALDDGFNLDAVSGYAFGMPTGTGTEVLLIDDMRLVVSEGVGMPEGVAGVPAEPEVAEPEIDLPEVVLPIVEPNPDFLGEMDFAEPIMLSDFEQGLPYVLGGGTAIGYVPWGDTTANTVLGITQVAPATALALPEQSEFNQVFRIAYDISAYGGFNHGFTDGETFAPQDWTNHNAFQFWLYGNNTGQAIQVEIFDNLNPDVEGDTAERYFYLLADNYEGWQQFTIPFAFFQRRTDFQPGGALDDGFGLNEVNGYAIGFPAGTGAQVAYIDQVQVVVAEDPSNVQIDGEIPPVTSIEIDDSITWDSREWELLWSDEFDADAGTAINDEYWTCETGQTGWGNNELQNYTTSIDNAAHDGEGNLIITAIQENENSYTSARCITEDKVEFTYGRVEARINIPDGQGIWPAFWMLGANFREVGWPVSGEIDILENIGREPNTIHGTVHGPGYSGSNGLGNSFRADDPWTDDFHVYAIDWDPYIIRWYVDGELYGTVSVNALQDNQTWVYDHDFFLLINVAVGGNWPGYPDETTEFPQEMLIDYIRVYQLDS